MNIRTFALAVVGIVAPASGYSEQMQIASPPVPPIAEPQVANYCIYGSLVYSLGSVLCVGKGIVCVPASGSTGGRGYWSQMGVTDVSPKFPAPDCAGASK
jgi:hypothetical protein